MGATKTLIDCAYAFYRDPESGGIYALDSGGLIMTREELDRIYCQMQVYYDFHGEAAILEHNQQRLDPHRIPTGPAPSPQKTTTGTVYVVKANSFEHLYKIGMTSRRTGQRLNEFAPKLPFGTELVYEITSRDPLTLERKLHARFADKQVRGEWFLLDSDDLKILIELGGAE